MDAKDSDIVFLYRIIMFIKSTGIGCRKTLLADHFYLSGPSFFRHIKRITGYNYQQLHDLVWSSLVCSYKDKFKTQKEAARNLNMSEKNFSIYLKRHPNCSSKSIASKEITMKNSKSEVLLMLATAPEPKTLKELNTTISVIRTMRSSGIEIISIPGRYKSGYKLDPSQHSKCLSWVNNWRVSMGKCKLSKIF